MTTLSCPDCGLEATATEERCPRCGARLSGVDAEADQSPSEDSAVDRMNAAIREKLDGPGWFRDSLPYRRLVNVWARARDRLGGTLSDMKERSSDRLPSLLTFLHTPDLRRWLDRVYEGTQTQYDRAMDAAFVAKQKAGELGYSVGQHRLFDEGHTLWGSFDRARDAVQGDSELTTVVEWSRSYMNDLTTPAGMPLVNLDPGNYDRWAEAFSAVPGVDKRYLFDLLNFDGMEVLASGLGVVGVVFALSEDDLERLSEVLGAIGINAVVAANPILGMATIVTTAYAYWRYEKIEGPEVVRGGTIAGVSALVFLSLGLPVLVELVVVVVIGHQLRVRVFEREEFLEWVEERARSVRPDLEKLLSVLPESSSMARRLRAYASGM